MKIKCPACSKVLSIPESAMGKVVKCPCGKQLKVPAAKPSAPAAASAAGGARPAAASPATPQPPAPRPAAKPIPAAATANPDAGGFFDELTETDLQGVKAVNKPGQAEIHNHSAGAKLLKQYSSGGGGLAAAGATPVGSMTLASPGSRILASLIDGLMYSVIIGTGFAIAVGVSIAIGSDAEGEPSEGALMALNIIIWSFFAIAYLINIVLITKSGQTVGKKAMGIRMVNSETGVNASFGDGWFTRNVVFGFLTGIPLIGFFVAIADIVYLFTDGHETLHDKLAKTMVVQNNR